MRNKIKIYIIDDHRLIVDGLIQMLSKYNDYEVVGFALNGISAIDDSKKIDVIDIFITDINLPDLDGLVVINSLKINFPDSKFIVLSMHNNKNIIKNAFQKGIMAYVLKNAGEVDLMEALDHTVNGKKYVSKEAIDNLIDSLGDMDTRDESTLLTDREITIAKLTAKGLTSTEIAGVLFISPRTVETHRRNIMHKLGFKTQNELIKYAIQAAWIDLVD